MLSLNYANDSLLPEYALRILEERYLLSHEKSPQEAFARAAKAFSDSPEMAQRVYEYASQLWFMFSTPILSNGGSERGLPISCYLNYVADSREGLTSHYTENAFLSSLGGGIGSYWGDVRSVGTMTSKGSQSTGIIPFIKVVDSEILAFNQGVTRRGSYAAYLDIDHPEILEFLDIRKPSGGDSNRRSLNIHHGVILSDEFMEKIEKAGQDPNYDDSFALIDPHSKNISEVVSAKDLWIKILQNRMETGEPYILFKNSVEKAQPIYHKEKNLKVRQSNLCSEITLPTNEERTAVCCLSSVNLEKWHEWKDHPHFIPDLIRFLDNVIHDFITKAPPALCRAVKSAFLSRDLGLGAMGWHSLLQQMNIPFESAVAKSLNNSIFSHIKQQAVDATRAIAEEKGEAPDAKGYGVRNAHLLAIAPNASSSIICGNTSPGVEPFRANTFSQKTLSGTHVIKNKYLRAVLQEKQKDTKEVWESIINNFGSVQHLDFLSSSEKAVFKTAMEIDQRWIIELAADRQKYVCQSQSINIFLPADINKRELHGVHLMAWKKGLKSLYYCRSEAIKRADNVSSSSRKEVKDFEVCLACEG